MEISFQVWFPQDNLNFRCPVGLKLTQIEKIGRTLLIFDPWGHALPPQTD